MINKAAAVLFHATPLIPFFMGYKYTGMAAILMVVLAYVKSNKLTVTLNERLASGSGEDAETRSLRRAISFWRKLTFQRKSDAGGA